MLHVNPPVLHQGSISVLKFVDCSSVIQVQTTYGLDKQFIKHRILLVHRHFDGCILSRQVRLVLFRHTSNTGVIPNVVFRPYNDKCDKLVRRLI